MRRIGFYSLAGIILILAAFLVFDIPKLKADIGDQATLGWDYTNKKDTWRVTSDGDLVPGTTNTFDIGTTVLYPAQICLGGVCKSGWGSIVSPMTDAEGYVYPTDSGGLTKLYDAGYIGLGGNTAVDSYILFDDNADDWYAGHYATSDDFVIGYGSTVGTNARISITDDGDNTIVTIGDNTNSYDHYIVFDGNETDMYLGYMDSFDMLIAGYGSTVDTDMCWGVEKATTPKLVLWNGIDGQGAIDLDYGSADITDHTFVSDGGTLIIDGTITLTDAEVISNPTDDTVRIASNDAAIILEAYTPGTSNENASLRLTADAGADAGDIMQIQHDGTTNSLFFQSDTASKGTVATILTLAKTGIITTSNAVNTVYNSALTNTVSDILNIKHSTSDTAAAGLGAGLTFYLEDASGNLDENASIDAVFTTATHGAEDTDIVFSQMNSGTEAETLRLVGDSSATTGSYLKITQRTTETDAVLDGLVLTNVTGTATTGMGMGISYAYEDAGAAEEQGSIDNVLTTATDTSEDSDFVFNVQNSGTIGEVFRIVGDSSATAGSYVKVTTQTTETDAVLNGLILTESAVVGATGNGLGISFQQCDAGGAEEQGSIDNVLTTATNAAEMSAFVFNIQTAGAIAETLRVQGASSATVSDYLQFTGNTTETNGVVDMVKLVMATGTATNDIGIGISWQPEDATGAEEHASLDVVLTDATRATCDADFVFTQDVNGELEERVRFDADGGTIKLVGTLPNIVIGDAGEEDTKIVFDGNAQDYHIGLDDAGGAEADLFTIGKGSALGTTPALTIDSDLNVVAVVSLKTPYEIVAATETLTANESHKLIVLNHATEFATTLPTVASSAGVTFHFVVGAAPSGASYTILTNGGENKIQGLAVVEGSAVPAVNEDTITFTDGAAAVGDWVELTSDGVNWYVSGQGVAATSIAFTAT